MTLSKEQRKAAINEFRERKSAAGAYSVKCIVNGRVWVGSSRNLDAAKNGIWFSLRTGGHRDKPLQDEWNVHGEAAFEYQVLETLKDDTAILLLPDLLKQTRHRWVAQLDARELL